MRLIDGDILLEQFKTLRDNWDTKNATHRAIRGAFVDCILRARDAPTVDAEPVKQGHWFKLHNQFPQRYQCSVCGRTDVGKFPFCHYCGARMDGEAE